MSLPLRITWPPSAVRKPPTVRRIVVLPQPDGPRRVTSSASATSRSMPRTPSPLRYSFVIPTSCSLVLLGIVPLLSYFILKPAARASAPANLRKTVRRTMVGITRMTANTAPAVDG